MGMFDAATNMFGGGGVQGYGDAGASIQKGIDAMRSSFAQGRDQFQPYQAAGTTALPQYQSSIDSLANPVSAYGNIMGQYTASPDYLFQQQQMQKAMQQSAAAGGTLGSPSQQQALAQYTQGLSSQDMQRYYGNVLGLQDRYQGGLSNLIGNGMNASNAVNQNYMTQGTNEGNLYNAMGNAQLGQAQAQAQGDGGLFSGLVGGFMGAPSMISGAKSSMGAIGNLFGGGASGAAGASMSPMAIGSAAMGAPILF